MERSPNETPALLVDGGRRSVMIVATDNEPPTLMCQNKDDGDGDCYFVERSKYPWESRLLGLSFCRIGIAQVGLYN